MVGTMSRGSIPRWATRLRLMGVAATCDSQHQLWAQLTQGSVLGANTNREEPVMGLDAEMMLEVLHGDEDRSFDELWAEAVHKVEFAAEPHHFDGLDDPSYLLRRDGVLRGMRVA